MHKEATLNFIVPVGEIKFILHDGKILNKNLKNYKIFCLEKKFFKINNTTKYLGFFRLKD